MSQELILAALPGKVSEIAQRTGLEVHQVRRATHKLMAAGKIIASPGQPIAAPNKRYEVFVPRIPPVRMAVNRPYVAPRMYRRPEFDAPGCVFVEHLTGKVLA